jgi:hypothetical protein
VFCRSLFPLGKAGDFPYYGLEGVRGGPKGHQAPHQAPPPALVSVVNNHDQLTGGSEVELRLTHVRHDRGVCPRLGEGIRKPLVGNNEHHREENSGKTSVEAVEFGQRASEPPTTSLLT